MTRSRLAIGDSEYDNSTLNNVGRVRIFDRIGGAWTEIGSIEGSVSGEFLGASLEMNNTGDRIVIGSPRYNDLGAVTIYDLVGTNWILQERILGENIDDRFGADVDIDFDGNTIIVGADEVGDANGAVYVYESLAPDNWELVNNIVTGDFRESVGTNVSISADGNRIASGSPRNFPDGEGVAKVFDRGVTEWISITAAPGIQGASPFVQLGASIDLSNDGNRLSAGIPPVKLEVH